MSWRLAPLSTIEIGAPSSSTKRFIFAPSFPLSVGFLPVLSPPRGEARSSRSRDELVFSTRWVLLNRLTASLNNLLRLWTYHHNRAVGVTHGRIGDAAYQDSSYSSQTSTLY